MKIFILFTILAVLLPSIIHAKDVPLIVKKRGQEKFETIVVDELNVDTIKNSGLYVSVEDEVWISRPDTNFIPIKNNISTKVDVKTSLLNQSLNKEEYTPNDPYLLEQYYFSDKSKEFGSVEILKAIRKSTQNKKLRIAVVDGGFHDHEDMDWHSGYNFFNEWGEIRQSEFRDFNDKASELSGCIQGHGLGVASIIGAKSNNETGISGVIDADLIALRVLSCGIGPLSFLADAVRYAAGGEVDDIPVIDKVDIINMSVAGKTPYCPSYLQEAIDFANAQGLMIFVAAGNYNEDITDYSPANCEGVYVSGATDKQGYKATFSNYGPLNSMAPGVGVLGYGASYAYGEISTVLGWWEGTSQASPLTAAIAGLGLQHNPELTREEVFNYLNLASDTIRDDVVSADQDCSTGQCGSGLINANRFMDLVIALNGKTKFKLRHALNEESVCDQTLLISEFGNTLPLCEMHELVMPDSFDKLNVDITLVKARKDQELTEANVQDVITITSTSLFDSLELDTYQYATRICLDKSCDVSKLISLDISEANAPSICQVNN